jgi:hypothetical protein
MADKELSPEARGVTDEDEAREMGESGMPRNLVLAVARDMHAMEVYAKMSEAERAAFLDRARQTPAGEPMQRLLRDMRYGEMQI